MSVVVLPVTLFSVPELMVGQCEPGGGHQARVEPGRRASACARFGYSFVAGLVILAGMLACCVGLLVALPVAYMLLLALFLALRQSSTLPPPVHT